MLISNGDITVWSRSGIFINYEGRYSLIFSYWIWAIDNSGDHAPDASKEDYSDVYAPVTVRLVKKYTELVSMCNTCSFTSIDKVLFADGTQDYLDMTLTHCDDISFLKEGTVYEQGTKIYSEGTASGFASHVHMEVRKRRNKSSINLQTYYYDQYGERVDSSSFKSTWSLVDNEPVQSIFFINDTNIVSDIPLVSGVSEWKIFKNDPFIPIGKPDGWYTFNGDKYYVKSEKNLTGWQVLPEEGTLLLADFYFDDDGILQTDRFIPGNNWYYVDETGKMVSEDWVEYPKLSGDYYYLDENGAMVSNQWFYLNNEWYYFNSSGVMLTGWFEDTEKGGWYFLNDGRYTDKTKGAMMRNRWVASGSTWYYVKESGLMAQNETLRIGDMDYLFDASGKCLNP